MRDLSSLPPPERLGALLLAEGKGYISHPTTVLVFRIMCATGLGVWESMALLAARDIGIDRVLEIFRG